MRKVKSFTLSEDVLAALETTERGRSTSDRVNELLRRALAMERREQFEQEAASFYAHHDSKSAKERDAYNKAAKAALSKD